MLPRPPVPLLLWLPLHLSEDHSSPLVLPEQPQAELLRRMLPPPQRRSEGFPLQAARLCPRLRQLEQRQRRLRLACAFASQRRA